jgi:hypothetical protein
MIIKDEGLSPRILGICIDILIIYGGNLQKNKIVCDLKSIICHRYSILRKYLIDAPIAFCSLFLLHAALRFLTKIGQ